MEFCLDLSHHPWLRRADQTAQVRSTLETIRVADEAGLDSVWLSEDPDGWDAFAVLAAAAPTTQQVRLGTGVTNPYLRHPNLIAMSVATLDRLSNGRAFLGLGRGQPEWYGRSLGMAVGDPLQALEQTIDLLQQWWRPPYRATSGEPFNIRDWPRALAPAQPQPPVYLAALGPKALALAARRADGVLIGDFASTGFLTGLLPELRAQVAAAGRDPADFAIFVRTAIELTVDPEPILERRKNLLALVNALPGMARQIEVPGFDVPAIMAEVRRVMHTDEVLARGGNLIDIRRAGDLVAARRLIPTELVAAVSYAGPAAELRSRLAELAGIGVTHVFMAPPRGRPTEEYAAQIASIRPHAAS